MNFLEKDLEEIIFDQLQTSDGIYELQERNFYLIWSTKSFRQLRIGNYGVADIVNVSRVGRRLVIDVIELKKDKISMSAFLQAIRYCKGISNFVKSHRTNINDLTFNIILIGRTIDKQSDFIYLPDFCSNITFLTYDYGVDGLSFKRHNNYSLSNEGF